jgi:transposase
MLADQLDYVIGVDPHRDSHALAIVEVVTGAVVFEANVAASSHGYAQALTLVEQHAQGRRVFAVEGTGSFGRGLTRFLDGRGERVLEVGRLRRERPSGRRRHVRAAKDRRCRHLSLHEKAPSTRSGQRSANSATC